MIPKDRPRIERKTTEQLLRLRKVSDPVCLVGIRGYYSNTMGAKGNDVGLYDDAIILVSPNAHVAWNANVDPSRLGWNANARKPMAQLKSGVYRYKLGQHGISRGNPYKALVQAGPVTVMRGDKEETGHFAINIHKGGRTTTSSEGCQTIPPQQWDAFLALTESELKRNNAKTLSYVLVNNS
jgi:lysozyme